MKTDEEDALASCVFWPTQVVLTPVQFPRQHNACCLEVLLSLLSFAGAPLSSLLLFGGAACPSCSFCVVQLSSASSAWSFGVSPYVV